MSGRKQLEQLIKSNKAHLNKYELALVSNPDDFGAKLMVGNIKRHLNDLESQLSDLKATKNRTSSMGSGSMAASSY